MRFRNREEAARLLVDKLKNYEGTHPLVLGIPRGAIPMAKIIAEGLQGECSAVLVRKIPAPDNEEFAIGSIGLSGHIQLMPYTASMHISETYIKKAAARQLELLQERQRLYGLEEPNYYNRIVIIVDDGIATGATTLSAIYEVQHHKPRKLIVTAAVSSIESAEKIRSMVDELVVLDEPQFFYGVSQFFDNFYQVTDEEVIELLNDAKNRKTGK